MQPGSSSSSGKKQELQPSVQQRSHMPAVGLPERKGVWTGHSQNGLTD